MKAEVVSTKYNGNQRTDTVEHTYNLSDDYLKLGQLYYDLGHKMSHGADEEDINHIKAIINAQLGLIKGYGDINASTTTAE